MSRYVTHFKGKDGNDYLVKDAEGRELKADIIHDTASGAIATFSDGADNLPMEMTVGIEPVQDLHGYESPWPGGGGKNLLKNNLVSRTASGVTVTVGEDGVITLNGTASATVTLTINNSIGLGAGSYKINGISNGSSSSYKLEAYYDGSWGHNVFSGDVDSVVSTSFNQLVLVVYSGAVLSNVVIKPMIRLSSVSDATFAPYSNICPISGWTGCNVSRTGFNQWDEVWEVGSINNDTGANVSNNTVIRSKNYIPVLPNTQYYFTTTAGYAFQYDADKNYLGLLTSRNSNPTNANCHYIRFRMDSNYGTTYKNDICINLSDPAKNGTYEPFKASDTYSITFPSEAGTVYGGTLTVNKDGTGTLVVDSAAVDLGTLTWTYYEAYTSFIGNVTGIASNSALLCSAYQSVNNWWTSSEKPDKSISLATNPYVAVKDSSYTSVSDFKTAMSGVQLVYELATTVTYNLTNLEVIETLKGVNNVWADTGDILSVTYPADTKLYIDEKVSELQALILENISNT